MSIAQVQQLFTYFIKGLTPHACDRVVLETGHGIPGDRAFALMYDEGEVASLGEPIPWLRKQHFAMQNDWPGLAGLSCQYDSQTETLTVQQQGVTLLVAETQTQTGRDRVGAFFTGYLAAIAPTETARHPQRATLRFVGNGATTRYPDREPVHISLVSQATLEDLSQRMGCPVDARRFRPNVVVTGVSAWEELNWVGKELQLGQTRIAIAAPINRCLNIDVNPDTGERDLDLFAALHPQFGHRQTGVLATVLEGGEVAIGDRLSIT